MLILTVDIGTSSVRVLLFDAHGRSVAGVQGSAEQTLHTTPDGGAELDADDLVERVVSCVEEALQRAGDRARHIAGVAVTTFWHSIVGVDAQGHALTPINLWADTRSVREVEELKRRLDERAVHARTGCVFHTSYPPAKILWFRRVLPEACRRVRWWMSPGEYLFLRLFGETRCSVSMASGTGLFNHARLDWDEEMLTALSLTRDNLAPLSLHLAPLRGITGEYAPRLHALRDVPWFPAVGDGACSNVGCGAVTPDRIALMVGTSGAMRVMYESGEPRAPFGLWCYRADARRFLLGGALSNGGNVFSWMRQTLRLDDDLETRLSQMPPDAHGLTVLPFLAGERSPDWRGDARAAIAGLSWNTEPIHILRAGLEAVAYRFALIRELLRDEAFGGRMKGSRADVQPSSIIATGGALLHSPTWMQMMADVLGEPVVESREAEASSRGAALLALEALGSLPSLRDASFAFGRTYEPNRAYHERYRAARERQQELYRKLMG
ncbi:MAG: gluconokinase [Abditibacteriales bacterium]|nr:gluconokinase [Abditibacteriales bacterium]MDW8366638.1 gluconokinase [Abditibacteriales bacterium]